MSRSFQKQLLINQIGVNLYLADDLLTIIKNYCFYDTKTYNIIKNTKIKKNKINIIIKKVLIFYNFYNDLYHHRWGVVMHTLDDQLPTLFLDNTMCSTCGNYINNTSSHLNIPRKIICRCHVNNLLIF